MATVMKKILLTLFIFCSGFAKGDSWTQKANFIGTNLDAPFSFSIDNIGYVGCGWDNTFNYTKSFWAYDQSSNSWTQKADFGGLARVTTTSFAIGNKGYAGIGGNGATIFQDFWEYDPLNNGWIQKSNFAGSLRYYASGFAIGNKGYVCCGTNSTVSFNDLWQYDPISDSWIQKTSLGGVARFLASCFVIGTNGYIIAGSSTVGYLSDLWEYNSLSDSWSQKANFPDTARGDAAAFSVCDKGYYGIGEGWPSFFTDLWQYDPLTNVWIQKTNFPGFSRDEVACFSIGNKGYIGLGANYSNFYDDFWEYTPDSSCVVGLPTANLSVPNLICPGTCIFILNLSGNASTYQWSFPGASPDTSTATNPTNICYPNPGTYDVQLIASNANGSDTLFLQNYITVYPSPPPQSITQSGDTLFAIAGSASYQWYFNGNVVNGATDYFYVAQASGDYNVVCTDGNGCEVEAAVFNVMASVDAIVDEDILIFPNPVGDKVIIQKLKVKKETAIEISVFNVIGESVVHLQTPNLKPETSLDVHTLSPGMYMIQLEVDNRIYRAPFVKE